MASELSTILDDSTDKKKVARQRYEQTGTNGSVFSVWAVDYDASQNIVQVGDKHSVDLADARLNWPEVVVYGAMAQGFIRELSTLSRDLTPAARSAAMAEMLADWANGVWSETGGRQSEIKLLLQALVQVRTNDGKDTTPEFYEQMETALRTQPKVRAAALDNAKVRAAMHAIRGVAPVESDLEAFL